MVVRLPTDISFQHGAAAWLVALVILLAQHHGHARTGEAASRAATPSACVPDLQSLAVASHATARDGAHVLDQSRLLAIIPAPAGLHPTLVAEQRCALPAVCAASGHPSLQPPARAPPVTLH